MPRLLRAIPPALAAVPAVLLLVAGRGLTVPLYAARQGLMCQSCHFDPNGGGPRNDFGFAFARNRHSLEADTTGAWKDLNLVNKVGDNFPLYFGVNQRLMYIANRQLAPRGLDHAGFYDMESSLHFAFQPHPRLTLVYSHDGFDEFAVVTKEAFGILSLTRDLYLRAGQFRVPFGLRLDDHTVATRNSFLDFETGQAFLPYDPRRTDRGVEVGGSRGPWFGRASFTDGASNPLGFANTNAQAEAAKLGFNLSHVQGAASFYDDYSYGVGPAQRVRATRWGYYGLGHAGPFAFLGEIAAGTDRFVASSPGPDVRVNLLAGWAEADYSPARAYNFRVRYDRLELDRASDPAVRDQNTYNRYALEGEVVPVPFAEIRWALRLIDPVATRDVFNQPLNNEKQGFIQFHFSY